MTGFTLGYGSTLHKNAPKRKRSRSRSGGLDGRDDLNYVDDESELSSGDDALQHSDIDTHQHTIENHTRKRGRPKVHHTSKEDRKAAPTPPASYTPTHSYTPPLPSGYVSDYDESGESKVDKFGTLFGGK